MIDLTGIPAPAVIEALDYEAILAQNKALAIAQYPALEAALAYESEPATKLLQVWSYRELLLRQRVNDAAHATMLAYATGTDLDNIAARYGVVRLIIQAADASATPPVAEVLEADTELRRRILLSLDSYTTAGSKGSYIYHALSASADVLDATANSPSPGMVTVYVLSRTGNGAAPEGTLAAVTTALNAETVRPLTDMVTVLSASVITYTITGTLHIPAGPDVATVQATAQAAAQAYADATHRFECTVGLSGIYRALHQSGVTTADLTQPTANITPAVGQVAYCTAINLTVEVSGG